MENSLDIKDQIVKNGFWNFITGLINKLGGFILVVLLSRLLMPEGFGRYSLAMTVSLFFITFSDMGINQALIRYVSLGIDKNSNQSASYFKHLFKIKFFIVFAVSMVLFALSYPLAFYVFKDEYLFTPFLILSFYVLFLSLSTFFESLFYIKKKVKYISIKEFIFLIIKILGILIIGFFIGSEFRLIGVFLLFLIISFLTLFFNFSLSKYSYPFLYKKAGKIIDKKGLSRFIFFQSIQNLSLTFISMITIILLGIFLAERYVGYYNSAWVLITSLSTLLFSFSYILLPILTNADEQKFEYILKNIFRLFFIFALPISFGLFLLSKYFISTIFGYEYLSASIPLSILAFIIPCMLGVDLALASFSAKNKLKKFAILMFISALIFLLLNYLFIKLFLINSGEKVIIGVSIANLVSWFFCFMFSIFLLKKEFNVNIISFWLLKPLISCSIMSGFILFIMKKIGEINLITGILIILSAAFIYLTSLLLIRGLKKEEITEALKILFKLKR